jgi:hypothetical protein
MAVITLTKSSQSYPGVAPTSQGGFGVTEVRLSTLKPYSPSWILPCFFSDHRKKRHIVPSHWDTASTSSKQIFWNISMIAEFHKEKNFCHR